MSRIRPSYYGIFGENDPQGLFPFDTSNEAVNSAPTTWSTG